MKLYPALLCDGEHETSEKQEPAGEGGEDDTSCCIIL